MNTANLRRATALARLLKRAGTGHEDAAPRIQAAHELTDAELRSVVRAIWGATLPFGVDRPEALSEPFCACGRVVSRCDGSRRGCTVPR